MRLTLPSAAMLSLCLCNVDNFWKNKEEGWGHTHVPAYVEGPSQKPLGWNQDCHKTKCHKGAGPNFLVHKDSVHHNVGGANPHIMEEQESL